MAQDASVDTVAVLMAQLKAAQEAIAEETRLRKEVTRRRQETERQLQEETRLRKEETLAREAVERQLHATTREANVARLGTAETQQIAQVIVGSRALPSSSIDAQLRNITYNVDVNECLVGMQSHEFAEAVAVATAARMAMHARPADQDDERAKWHPYFKMMLLEMQREARRLREEGVHVQILKPFYERAAPGGNDKRADFTFTRPCEQRLELSNMCTWLEVKRVQRTDMSESVLMREAVAQVIRYMAIRDIKLRDNVHGDAVGLCVTGANNLVVVRIRFSEPTVPVMISPPLALLPPLTARSGIVSAAPVAAPRAAAAAAASSGVRAESIPGLVALTRVLTTTEVAPFGLGHVTYTPVAGCGFENTSVLGDGGFATVVRLTHNDAAEPPIACKFLRGGANDSMLENELGALVALAGLSNVPTAVGAALVPSATGLAGLWMRPVGSRMDTGHVPPARVLDGLWRALIGAHSHGIMHMDVRPSNTIKCDAADDGIMLIDWGLAEHSEGVRARLVTRMYGERAFMSCRRLRVLHAFDTCLDAVTRAAMEWTPCPEDDLEAAVWTFFAFVAHVRGNAPWADTFLQAGGDLMSERADWVRSHEFQLREAAAACTYEEARGAVERVLSECAAAR